MHIVIMGCGRVGSDLAQSLEEQGHTVAVIDQDPTAFRRLGSSFGGRRVTGVGFDQDTLREAGIEEAGAFAAVSSGDRKSTRLNSSHGYISYAVFCLKNKNKIGRDLLSRIVSGARP